MHSPNGGYLFIDIIIEMPALAFLVIYATRSRWYKNYVGWAVMGQSLMFNFTFLYLIIINIWTNAPFQSELRYTMFSIIAVIMYYLLAVLMRAQREQPAQYGRRSTDVTTKEKKHDNAPAR